MTRPVDDLVWYAAYGSNLWRARFLTYLRGGPVPHATVDRHQRGARDPSPPRADAVTTVPHRLFFARAGAAWGGGGVAMLDPRPDASEATLCRLWLITARQFEDVFAQENGSDVTAPVDVARLLDEGHLDLLDGWYGRALHLGPGPGGRPVLTLTCADPDAEPRRAAHASYNGVIGLGLIEGWGHDDATAARYLAEREGNRGAIDVDALSRHLTELRSHDEVP